MNETTGWDIAPKYKFQRLLGSGSYGSVCLAASIKTKSYVAIKKFTNIFEDHIKCKRVLREVELLHSIDNPYVVKPLDVFMKQGTDIYLVMEIGQIDLSILRRSVFLVEKQVKAIMYRLLVALNYLHSGGIVHRDVKPANLLINHDCSLKLCDFSLGRSINGLESSYLDSNLMLLNKPSFKAFKDPEDEEMCDEIDEGEKITPKIVHCKFQVNFEKSRAHEEEKMQDENSHLEKVIEAKRKNQRNILLTTSKSYQPIHKRELSGHITTRWYRPPEIILLERIYTTAVDMWSAGCVFAELLEMIVEVQPDITERSALFPGESCFPLSPSDKPTGTVLGLPIAPKDQLSSILRILGEPSSVDLSFLNDQRAVEYVKALASLQKQTNLRQRLPRVNEYAIDLLTKLLSFNPFSRITAKEALGHPYFSDIRNKKQEIEMGSKIELVTDRARTDNLQVLANEVLKKVLNRRN